PIACELRLQRLVQALIYHPDSLEGHVTWIPPSSTPLPLFQPYEIQQLVPRDLLSHQFVRLDHLVRQIPLLLKLSFDLLLERAPSSDGHHDNLAFLAEPVHAIDRLVLHRRVPPTVVQDHVVRRLQIEPDATGAQRHHHSERTRTGIELSTQAMAVTRRHRSVDEHALFPQGPEVVVKVARHGDVLAKADEFVPGAVPGFSLNDLIQDLDEGVELAGDAQLVGLEVARDEARMTADLLETCEDREDVRIAKRQLSAPDRLYRGLQIALEHGPVQVPLLLRQLAPKGLGQLLGQLVGHLFLQASQQKRTRPATEQLDGLAASLSLDGISEVPLKFCLRTQVPGGQEVEDCPQITQAVLYGSPGDGDPGLGRDFPDRLCPLGPRILHPLGLVRDQEAPTPAGEQVCIPDERLVGRDDDIRGPDVLAQLLGPSRACMTDAA